MKVTMKKSVIDRYNDDIKHDELVSMLAAKNGAGAADAYYLKTRTTNSFAWIWLISGLTLGVGGLCVNSDATMSVIFIVVGLLAIPFINKRKKNIETLRAQSAVRQQKQHSMTPEEERAALKEEVRREMLKEELRKEILAEKRKN